MPTVLLDALTLNSVAPPLAVHATPVCELQADGGGALPGGNDLLFGEVDVGSTSDVKFWITNSGYGTLSGTASIDSAYTQFEIIGSASYSLTHNQIKEITVRYTPNTYGVHTGVVETGNDTY